MILDLSIDFKELFVVVKNILENIADLWVFVILGQ